MTEHEIKQKLEQAVNQMLTNQPNFFDFTPETHESEWNISHHLANEVSIVFREYDCDFDIIKQNFEKRRPDIIFHKRGSHDDNFLVIEVKREQSGIKGDIEKIEKYWFQEPLAYKFGAVIVVNNHEDPTIVVIKNSHYD
jgi:hypothetical protein